jgi:hypothetical protein
MKIVFPTNVGNTILQTCITLYIIDKPLSYFLDGAGARMIVILFPSSLGSISSLP